MAASVALRNPVTAYPPVMIPNFPHPGMLPPTHAVRPNVFAGPALVMQAQPPPPPPPHRGPVPNSFVPLQVTRQTVQLQQSRTQEPGQPQSPQQKRAISKVTAQPDAAEAPPHPPEPEAPAASSVPQQNSSPASAQGRPLASSKPPGSRLAIRFNGP